MRGTGNDSLSVFVNRFYSNYVTRFQQRICTSREIEDLQCGSLACNSREEKSNGNSNMNMNKNKNNNNNNNNKDMREEEEE